MSLAFDDKNHLSKNRLIPDLLTCKLEELSLSDKTTLFSTLIRDWIVKRTYINNCKKVNILLVLG